MRSSSQSSRILRTKNHAVFCVMPKSRRNYIFLTSFKEVVIRHIAIAHIRRGGLLLCIGDLVLTMKRFRQFEHQYVWHEFVVFDEYRPFRTAMSAKSPLGTTDRFKPYPSGFFVRKYLSKLRVGKVSLAGIIRTALRPFCVFIHVEKATLFILRCQV